MSSEPLGRVAICTKSPLAENGENLGLLFVDREKRDFKIYYQGTYYAPSTWANIIRVKLNLSHIFGGYEDVRVISGQYQGRKVAHVRSVIFP